MKLLVSALIFSALACSSLTQDQVIERIENEAFEKLIGGPNVQIVDVRTLKEYSRGHLRGSILIDFYSKTFKEELLKLDRERPVALYCAVGGRSRKTAYLLKDLGFKKIYDLKYGIKGWIEDGKEIVK